MPLCALSEILNCYLILRRRKGYNKHCSIICMSEILLNIEHRKDPGIHEGEAKGQEHMEYIDGAYKKINYILVSLINEIWELEGKAIITEEFADLTNNDMHVIEAVGLGEGNNMSCVARRLNITTGSLTTSMNHLVKKQYVERRRSEKDRRVVFVKLTEKGIAAYRHHEDYHRRMTQAVLERLDEEELPVLVKTLDALSDFFKEYSNSEATANKSV